MQIGRPLMSDSAATDNFARPFARERTEFGSDPDFSPASISKTHRGGKNQFHVPHKNSQWRQCHSELYLLNNFNHCNTLLDSVNRERFVDLYI